MFADGDADLDLAADMLANGKTSRLYRRLVFEERIATDVSAAQNSREIAGFVQLAATAAPGPLAAGDRSGDRRRNRDGWRRTARPRTRSSAAASRRKPQFMFRLQTVGGFGGKSDQLNAYNTFLGDPGFFDRDLARYRQVTPSSLERCGGSATSITHAAWRSASCRRAGWSSRFRGPPCGRQMKGEAQTSVRSRLPEPGPARPFFFPPIEKSTLASGLRVWTVAHTAIPVVTVLLLLRRGSADDPPGHDGLAALTVDMLDEGSGGRSAIEMHEALARIGAQLDSDIGSDAAVLTITALSRFSGDVLRAARRHDGAAVADRRRLRARASAAAAPPDAAARHARRGRRPRVREAAVRIASLRAHAARQRTLAGRDHGRRRPRVSPRGDAALGRHADRGRATATTPTSHESPRRRSTAGTGRRRRARRRRRRCRVRRASASCRGRGRRSRSCASGTSRCRAIRPTTTRWWRRTWCSADSSSAAST